MERLDFSNKEFQEIPEQDNPAFSLHVERCLMLVKAGQHRFVGESGVTVLEIDNPNDAHDRVNSLGHFHSREDALLFSDAFMLKEKASGTPLSEIINDLDWASAMILILKDKCGSSFGDARRLRKKYGFK